MTLIFETNGKGFMGWIAELSGAFVRGATADEVRRKIPSEFVAYAEWLQIAVADLAIHREETVVTTAAVEDGDTNICLEVDRQPLQTDCDLEYYCRLMELSAEQVRRVFDVCSNRDVVAPSKNRRTFYGPVYATVEAQYQHVVRCQQYYLESVGISLNLEGDLRSSRLQVVKAIRTKGRAEGNVLCSSADEDWTLRKVIRRMIWHDRIHARAMARMNKEVCT